MVNETQNKPIEWIQKLEQFLPEKKQEELAQILQYGNEIKKRGEGLKEKFWKAHFQGDFQKLIIYHNKHRNELESKYKFLDTMRGLEREKFIEEYLYDDMLYDDMEYKILSAENIERKTYSYKDWKEGKVVMEEGVILDFEKSGIGDDEAEELAQNLELKEGVTLRLGFNNIGDRGLKAISKMKLKKGVEVVLEANPFGDDGLEALCNMKMEDGVYLFFGFDIMKHSHFFKPTYSDDAAKKVRELGEYYNSKGIHCMIDI